MTSSKKIWEKIKSKPNRSDIKMTDLQKLLEDCGYTLQSQKSSHSAFKHPDDSYILTIVCRNATGCPKSIYIKKTYDRIIGLELYKNVE